MIFYRRQSMEFPEPYSLPIRGWRKYMKAHPKNLRYDLHQTVAPWPPEAELVCRAERNRKLGAGSERPR